MEMSPLHHRYFLRSRTTSLHHNNNSQSDISSSAPVSLNSRFINSQLILQMICRATIVMFHISLTVLTFLPTVLAAAIKHLCIKSWTPLKQSIESFFYGTNSSSFFNQSESDTLDPLTDAIRRFPSHAAWFMKAAMLFGAASGILLSFPVAYYLNKNWDFCSMCPKPLRWWLFINCSLQIIQVPLRISFYYCINVLERSVSRFRQTDSEQFQLDFSVESDEAPIRYRSGINTDRQDDNHRDLVTSNFTSEHRSIRRRHQNALMNLSRRLIGVTNGPAWRFSVWLSIAAYTWFLVGILWIINAQNTIRCCCNNHGGKCSSTQFIRFIDGTFSLDEFSFIQPDIKMLTLIVLIISAFRLAIVILLFFFFHSRLEFSLDFLRMNP